MITPKFAYNPGSGVVDLVPTYPPVKKVPVSIGPLTAVRTDSLTSSGVKQSVLERIDQLVPLTFEDVPEADLTTWNLFFAYALGGGQFTYYPDSTNPAVYQDYTLENTDWAVTWKSWKNYGFTMLMRLFVGTPTYYS